MLLPKSNIPRWIVVIADIGMSIMALLFAYLIRFDLEAKEELILNEWAILSRSIGIYILIKLAVFYAFGIHKGLIRHTSTQDFARIVKATAVSSILFLILGILRSELIDGYYLFPMSVLIMEFTFSTIILVGSRFAIKLIYLESVKTKDADQRVLIYGAGISGMITKRTIEKDPKTAYRILGFVDDNKKLTGNRLEGITIYHTSRLEKIIQKQEVTQLIIAIQDPDDRRRKEVVEICLANNVSVQKVPSTKSWINGEFSTKQISKIKISDLLGRKPIKLDEAKINDEMKGEVILRILAQESLKSELRL